MPSGSDLCLWGFLSAFLWSHGNPPLPVDLIDLVLVFHKDGV